MKLGERYALGDVLGSGGAARVHRATDTLLGVDRAVKLLLDAGPHAELLRSRLRNEARVMAQLKHPNVLRIYDIGVHEGQDFIVMDLAEGGSLSQWLDQEGPLHPAVAVHYTLQVLSALDAAHQAGVVHRDVKPQNVLLDRHGGAMLADFGIALLSEDALRTTRTNMAMGSMCFMAPEQRMDAKHVGPEADLYAVACSLYNLLTDGNPIDLFTANASSGRWDEVPEVLRPILWRATRHDPAQRYLDAASMAAELARALPELGALPTAPRADEASPVNDSIPLPTPEATASAISRIADSRVRRITAATPAPASPSDSGPSQASETFLPMDLDSDPDGVLGSSFFGADEDDEEDAANPTLIPRLDEALAQLNAAVPHEATLIPPPIGRSPTQTPSAATMSPAPAEAPLARRGLLIGLALALLLLLLAGLPPMMRDPVSVTPTNTGSATTPSVETPAVAEPEEPEPQEPAVQPAVEPEVPVEAPTTQAPAGGSGDPPSATPSAEQPSAEAQPSTSAVAGTWSITSSAVAMNTEVQIRGSDERLRGQLLLPAGVKGAELTGSYSSETGRLTLYTKSGSKYLEVTRSENGRAMTGKVFDIPAGTAAILGKK